MSTINLEDLVKYILDLKESNVAVTFHSMGDTDAISSAIAFLHICPNAIILNPDRLTNNALRIKNTLGFSDTNPQDIKNINQFDAIVLLDVNNTKNCGKLSNQLESFKGDIFVIDHHMPKDENASFIIFDQETYNSTASIMFEILKYSDTNITSNLARILAMGLISDSAEFKNATPQTFSQLGELFKIGNTDYISLMEQVAHISPASERIKTVYDIKNANVVNLNGLLFIHGYVHAYANLAAESAMRIGADVSLFCSLSNNEVSFSARLRPNLDKKYSIHLGGLLNELSSNINGTGGGHPCAAGAYGSNSSGAENFISKFIARIDNQTRANK